MTEARIAELEETLRKCRALIVEDREIIARLEAQNAELRRMLHSRALSIESFEARIAELEAHQ